MVDNPFAANSAADYHRFRPYHHERTLERAFGIATPTGGRCLDVACGTGLSTLALDRFGFRVIGLDASLPMLRVARAAGVTVILGNAEFLPIEDGSCDLLTCGSGIHWLDPERFWHEARRVLRPQALVVIYDHGFLGQTETAPDFSSWYWEDYQKKYPAPPRFETQPDSAPPQGLIGIGDDSFTETIPLDRDQLVGYLLTQSNTIVARTNGNEDRQQIAGWLTTQTAPFFTDPNVALGFAFWGRVRCFRRSADAAGRSPGGDA